MSARLEELAGLHGIALTYDDIWGQAHATPPQVLVDLLAAMGVPADGDPAVEAALEAHALTHWRTALPACWATDEAGSRALPLRLPAEPGARSLNWVLTEEGGARHQGAIEPPGLPELRRASVAGAVHVERAFKLPVPLPIGYHRLELFQEENLLGVCRLIIAPATCYMPPVLQGEGRAWGSTAQLYAVRSQRNWGIGDFTDLAALIDLWGRHGASLVGVNPLHAMFPHNPAHASPYSPSSRLFVNIDYLDVEAIDDFDDSEAARRLVHGASFEARLQQLRAAEFVDHVGVSQAKREVLELLWQHFRAQEQAHGSDRAREFQSFVDARGEPLRRHALFEALQERFHAEDAGIWGWPVWPEAYRSPDAVAVQQFARDHADRVGFYQYLQWQADKQLYRAGQRSYELGLGIGLYQDLAVSIDRAGAEAWSEQGLYAGGVSIGAPPDDFNLKGQNWGLPPLLPQRLVDAGHAPFIETLRANMRHAGALRIDHVMALRRLYWIAEGADAADGAYVSYPFADLLAIVRLESHRNQCLVIGEDLGTVPQEVRDQLSASGVLSYRLLFFERGEQGAFQAASRLEPQALLAGSTHDLPTLAGWWSGGDLALRDGLGLYPSAEMRDQQVIERAQDRARLLIALEHEALLPPGTTVNPGSVPEMTPALSVALHRHLARGPSKVVVTQLEDVINVQQQVNLPGTTDAHPNWKRKLPLPIEHWASDERFLALARMFQSERGTSRTAASAAAGAQGAAGGKPLQAATPCATYRVQLHAGYTFRDATALVPYLADMGMSHLYCSPFLRARAGSQHGYDVVDHSEINPEIGTRADFDALVEALHGHRMGLLIDVVPNHMGVLGGDNAWWQDVLENGQASAYAEFFDIDWHSSDPALTGRVLLPILGDQYGVVLERGEIQLNFDAEAGRFTLSYYEHRLPIDPIGYGALIRQAVEGLPPDAVPALALDELATLADSFEALPARDEVDADTRPRRARDKNVFIAQLAQHAGRHPALARAIGELAVRINGQAQVRASVDALDALIDAQAYRLAQWRAAADQINYRRFFDINELAALRMERPEVFEATHHFILSLAASGAVNGMRIDHPDGLADPAAYFLRLQQRYAEMAGGLAEPGEGDRGRPATPLYVVVEKITAPHEQVPLDWAVHGTTGYRFANVVNGLLIDGDAKSRLDRVWRAFVGDERPQAAANARRPSRGLSQLGSGPASTHEAEDFDELAWRCRHIVMDTSLAGEMTVLAAALLRLAREDRRTRDFTINSLRRALTEVVASFPVYRTYLVDEPSAQDRRFVDWAIGRARRRSPTADASIFEFLRRVMLGRPLVGAPAGLADRYRAFARRLQQYTAPVAAKGIEDTALYRHHRLISVNDVGGDPDAFGVSVAAFHAASRERAQHWPHTMLATSTHDAKRSEDVRARINVISEMPAAWRLTVRRWSRLNRRHQRTVDGARAPTRNDEYLLYQTLVGSLPAADMDDADSAAYAARVEQAMLKSARESKVVTSWLNPNADYEAALSGFVQGLLAQRESNLFRQDLLAVGKLFAWYGALNGLTITAVKCLSPGVPDFYQGHEAIELSLIDPDNRRPVDHGRRRALLAQCREWAARPDRGDALRDLLSRVVDGDAKFYVTWCALALRRERHDMLLRANHLPLDVTGARARHVVAFARHDGDAWVIVVAARLYASLGLAVGSPPQADTWGDTALWLPEAEPGALPARGGFYLDVVSGRRLTPDGRRWELSELLGSFPVAVLDLRRESGG